MERTPALEDHLEKALASGARETLKARELTRRKSVLEITSLPEVADCTERILPSVKSL